MNTVIILVGVILVIAIFLFVKLKYVKHKLAWFLILGLVVFIYITFTLSILGKNVDLNTLEGIGKASTIYYTWLANSFSNVRSITGNAVKMDWGVNATSIFSK